jgi:hypothetical protein
MLKKYSDKRSAIRRVHAQLPATFDSSRDLAAMPLATVADPIVASDYVDLRARRSEVLPSTTNDDRSLLGRLLKTILERKPCQKVIENEQHKKVRIKHRINSWEINELYNGFLRISTTKIGKMMKQIHTGNKKQKNTSFKVKLPRKLRTSPAG